MRDRRPPRPQLEILDGRVLPSASAVPHAGQHLADVEAAKAPTRSPHATGTVSGLAAVDTMSTEGVVFVNGSGKVRPFGRVTLDEDGGGNLLSESDGLFGDVSLTNKSGSLAMIELTNAATNTVTSPTTTLKYEMDRLFSVPGSMDAGSHPVGFGTAVISFPQGLPKPGGPALPYTLALYPKR